LSHDAFIYNEDETVSLIAHARIRAIKFSSRIGAFQMINLMGNVDTSYESDHTKWMREMVAKNPQWDADQKAGRALWWDKKQDVDATTRNAESNVAQKPYPYDVHFFGA
jgi:hypothetical protein